MLALGHIQYSCSRALSEISTIVNWINKLNETWSQPLGFSLGYSIKQSMNTGNKAFSNSPSIKRRADCVIIQFTVTQFICNLGCLHGRKQWRHERTSWPNGWYQRREKGGEERFDKKRPSCGSPASCFQNACSGSVDWLTALRSRS